MVGVGRTAAGVGLPNRRVHRLAHLPRQLLQRGDAVLGRGMGGEEVIHPAVGERVDDEQMRGRRRPLRSLVLDRLCRVGNPGKRRSERVRAAADARPEIIRGIFPRAADRHLHDHGGKRRQNDHEHRSDQAEPVVAVARAAAEEQTELRQHGDGARDGRRNSHGQRIVVADVGELVGDHARNFVAVERVDKAGAHCDRGMLGVAPGGERVGLRVVHDVDARHGDARALREIAHELDQLGRGAGIDLPRSMQGEHELVRIPIAHEVHDGCNQQRHDRAARAADEKTDSHEQGREPCQQHGRSHIVHGPNPNHDPGRCLCPRHLPSRDNVGLQQPICQGGL